MPNAMKTRNMTYTGWDEARQMFTGYRNGTYPGYFGPIPMKVAKDDCPHEWKSDEPNCFRCGAVLQPAK